ncbi:hypothetical protein Tco_1486590 [Tanacetum coccineum]
MNYQPVTAGNQTNKNTGPQEANGDTGLKKSVDARQSKERNVSTQQYIVFPLWSSISSSYKSLDETYKNDIANDATGETPVQKLVRILEITRKQSKPDKHEHEKERKHTHYTKARPKEAHELQRCRIAILAIRVTQFDLTAKIKHPMIGRIQGTRSKATKERVKNQNLHLAPINRCLTPHSKEE